MEQTAISSSPIIRNKNFENKTKAEQIKEKWEEIPDGDKKLMAGMGALATLAVATLAIYQGKNKNIDTKTTQKALKTAEEAVENLNDKTKEAVQNVAQNAKEKISSGADYRKIRRESLKNLVHDDKKTIKDAIKEGVEQKRKAEAEQVHSLIDKNETVKKMTQQTQQANQGIKSSISTEELQARKQAARQASEVVRETADELQQNAKTRKEIKFAKQAESKAQQAKLNAQKVETNADKRIAELEENAKQKARNIEIQKSSPNYEQGIDKQTANGKKAKANAEKRKFKREYERAYRKYINTPKEKLLVMSDGKNLSEIERKAIKDILDKCTSPKS